MSTKTHDDERQLIPGQMLGRYELLTPIATGGMGMVWAARLKGSRGFRKLVAIKTILRSFENAESEEMLLKEATLASQIHHPNVAETLELGEQDGMLYLVMELVSGESLSFILKEAEKHGGMPLPIAINLVGQVCRGLQAAHDLRDERGERIGLIHRDISPPNVLVDDSGTVKIVDFGVATTTSNATFGSGEIKGKISYLAPEQIRGEAIDERVDVFTTGILLYLLTVGRHPFRADGEVATIARLLSDTPAAPPSSLHEDYPEALEGVVLRAVDKCRDTRFPSALALLEALEQAWPDAFGARADEALGAYVRELTKERAAKRRAALRLAEELSENSGSRHSVHSVTAIAASLPSAAKRAPPHRLARVGALALGVGLVASAAVLPAYLNLLQTPAAVPLAMTPAILDLGELGRSVQPVAGPIPAAKAGGSEGSTDAVPALTPPPRAGVASQRDTERSAPLPRAEPSEPRLAGNEDQAVEERPSSETDEPQEETPSTPSADTDPAAALPVVLPPIAAATATTAAPAVAAPGPLPANASEPSRAIAPVPTAPRFVPSKVGHGLLRIDPQADAYRVRLPAALNRSGQAFRATVKICVDDKGTVSSITVLRSAGPAIDAQVTDVLSRWRYRPLLQSGRETPFCYSLAYAISD